MGMTRRDTLKAGLASMVAASALVRPSVAQQQYPERAIKLIIPFGPGGVSDVVARLLADKFKTLLGPVFIENQGGGGGSIGRAMVMRAAPDGHTILLGGAGQVVMPIAASQAPIEPAKDLEPISILVIAALTVAVHPSVPARNLRELADYAKSGGVSLSYGSAAPGTMAHLTGQLLKSVAGIPDLVHVPYKGGGQSIVDLVSGHIPMVTTNITNQVLDLHHAGKIRVLAVTSPARVSVAPDIPTAIEAGLPGLIVQNFIGLFAPPATPNAIVRRISQATRESMADQEFRQKLIATGFEPFDDSSPEAARRLVDGELGRLGPVIKEIGLKLE